MRLKILYFVVIVFLTQAVKAQIPVGSWQIHLPYQNVKCIANAGNYIYGASASGLFSYNKNNGEIRDLSKIDGLSDVEPSTLAYSSKSEVLVIGYKNGNIDLWSENSTPINISDIKRKLISADKRINHILIIDAYAYLSCGFGIVVINTDKQEVADTYIIGEGSTFVNINELAYNDSCFYAATNNGIFKANRNNNLLVDYKNWSRITNVPNSDKSFSSVAWYNEHLFALYDDEDFNGDTLYQFYNNQWSYFDTTITTIRKVNVSKGKLILLLSYNVWVLNDDLEKEKIIYTYGESGSEPNYALIDDNNYVYIADKNKGIVKYGWVEDISFIYPNGPMYPDAVDIKIYNNKLLAAGGSPSNPWADKGAYTYINGSWNSYNKKIFDEFDGLFNISTVVIDPSRTDAFYGGSHGYGLVEFSQNEVFNVYDETNSILQTISGYGHGYLRIDGLAFDYTNNLWILASKSPKPIYVKKADGDWINFEFNNIISSAEMNQIIVTQSDHKWSIINGYGLFAFSVNGTIDDFTDDQYKKFMIKDDEGNSISTEINVITEDKEGLIWVGLNGGVAVYSNPENVFGDQAIYASRPIIEVDNDYQYLLHTEAITDIAIDGGNRKWFATQNSGVYLMSPDGKTQILNFNEKNSPLISNNVMSIGINHDSGEVFFGTDKGIVSYKSTATAGDDEFSNVYVYPNPVREDYDGIITITGLASDVDVKITDISGNLVYKTTATGGQAVWNGKSLNGEKVHTGVYLVFCTNDDGTKTHITKLLFVN